MADDEHEPSEAECAAYDRAVQSAGLGRCEACAGLLAEVARLREELTSVSSETAPWEDALQHMITRALRAEAEVARLRALLSRWAACESGDRPAPGHVYRNDYRATIAGRPCDCDLCRDTRAALGEVAP